MATTKKVLNLNIAKRGVETGFLELVPTQSLGPAAQASAATTTPNVNAVLWDLVPSMTNDLKTAIIQFIDKDKSGKFVPILANLGRTKTITFEFQGSPSKVYKFGELGLLNIILSYPPSAKATTGLSSTANLNVSAKTPGGPQLNTTI